VNHESGDSTASGYPEGSATLRLAASMASLSQASCQSEVLAHARRVFADTIACIIGGLTHPELECLGHALHRPGTPERFTGVQAAPSDLALLLGFAGSALELDEGHYAAGGHPAVHAAAAVLAESVQRRASDDDCLMAFLAGYEAGARVGAATRLRPAVHPHGTWGVIGAAVGVAWLRGYNATQMTAVINVASSLGLATSASAPPRGASVRSAWVGVAARNGLLACDLVQAGVTGEPDGCAAIYGQVLGTDFDSHRLTDRLGEHFYITDNFMKCHASCRETHGAIAALTSALSKASHQAPLKPEHVLRIEIETFADAARLSDVHPVNEMAARFSIPAAVASMMLDGEVGADSFLHDRLERPALRALMQRVSVREAPDATQALPARRICRCHIVLTDGTLIAAEVDAAPGDSVDRLSIGTLRAKIDTLCGRSKNQEDAVLKARVLHMFLT
jgi:2-methylcitrate dehydratase PrpD